MADTGYPGSGHLQLTLGPFDFATSRRRRSDADKITEELRLV